MKIWITKYALTSGVKEVDGTISGEIAIYYINGTRCTVYGKNKNWHTTVDSAIKKAEEMRIKKLQSLDSQIKKYSKMKFVIN